MIDRDKFKVMSQKSSKEDDQINNTHSLELLDNNQANGVKYVLKKYSNIFSNYMEDRDKVILLQAREEIQRRLPQRILMCKVIPMQDLNKYLNFNYNIGTFMFRKADITYMQENSYYTNVVDMFYNCLRLDYEKSMFIECNRMAIIELEIKNYSGRVPLNARTYNEFNENKIEINKGTPYTGIGWTLHECGVPEFYVTISENSGNRNADYDKFPLFSFYAKVYIADKETNKIMQIARYDNDTYVGKLMFNKFEKCCTKEDKLDVDRIIKEEKLCL